MLYLASQIYRWNALSLSTLTAVSLSRATAYATHLQREDVLVERGGFFTRGWVFDQWAAEESTSHPGGNSLEYRQAAALRAEAYHGERAERLALGVRLRQLRGARSLGDVAEASLISKNTLSMLERGLKVVRPATLARILAELEG